MPRRSNNQAKTPIAGPLSPRCQLAQPPTLLRICSEKTSDAQFAGRAVTWAVREKVISFSVDASSIDSASSFLSLRFSSSRAFSLRDLLPVAISLRRDGGLRGDAGTAGVLQQG
jgi:hypothetical protein